MEWEELINKLDNILYKLGSNLVARDTHRWIESDGWYELQISFQPCHKDNIDDEDGEIYLITVYDYDGDLESEYSPNNPQIIYQDNLTQCLSQDQLEEVLKELENIDTKQ